jgi:hypothetical protein
MVWGGWLTHPAWDSSQRSVALNTYYPTGVIRQPPYLNFFQKMRFLVSKRCTKPHPRGRGVGAISFDACRSGLLNRLNIDLDCDIMVESVVVYLSVDEE